LARAKARGLPACPEPIIMASKVSVIVMMVR
jgi:hypothetical protein